MSVTWPRISLQMVQKIFLAQLLFLRTSVEGWIFVSDRFGFITLKMNRQVECGSNVTSFVNDYERIVYVVCRGNIFDAEQIRVCTNSTYFASVVLRDCVLPSPDVRTSLANERVEKFFLISEDVPPNSQITIRNLSKLRDIVLYHMENVSYNLERLPNIDKIYVLRVMTEKFPNGLLNGLPSVKLIYIVSGRIRSFPEDAFRGLNRLKSLHLFGNRLENLPETLFRGLRSLEDLRLHSNSLTFLPPSIFRGLTNLKRLTLNDNRLNNLPPSLFADNFNLIILNMNNNSFRSLPEVLLQNVSKLQRFAACNCEISHLPAKVFSSCYDLTEVQICENRIDHLHPDLFVNNALIEIINLHHNHLQELPSNVFRRNKRLTTLNLSKNFLTTISFEVFSNIRNIQILNLTGNRMTKIEEEKFDLLKNLRILYLNNNPLGSLPEPTPFGRLPYLTSLGLSNTSLTEFPRIDWTAYNILLLSLTQNRLSILHTEDLPPDNRSVILLMDNNITTVEGKITRNMNNVIVLLNPLRCDCDLKNYIDEVQFLEISRLLLCDSPSDLTNKTFKELVPSYVVCPVVENCPPKCRCYLYKGLSVMVNCSFSNISHAPAILPENTTIVHLEHNSLSTMEITDNWSGVTELYLDHNRLNPSEHWTFPSSLKVLSLRNNSLQDFPEKFMQYVSDSSYIRVDIRNNAFWCNCSFKPFKLWLNRNVRKIVEAEEVKCSRLLSENNTVIVSSVLNFPDDAFCLPRSIVTNVALIVFGSMVCLLGILAMVFAFLFLKYKNTTLAYVYVHLPSLYCCKISELDKDKAFDAFISYCVSDRDIVMRLLKELEETPPFFKLCIHERNWMPGYDVKYQIEASIRSSDKTMLLLSAEFLSSVWSQAEFRAALVKTFEHKTENIIFVLKDNSMCDVIPADMREFLLSRTYLVWGERWFWEKLRYALPRYSSRKSLRYRVDDVSAKIPELSSESAPVAHEVDEGNPNERYTGDVVDVWLRIPHREEESDRCFDVFVDIVLTVRCENESRSHQRVIPTKRIKWKFSLQNATEMKMKNLFDFLVCIALTQCCNDDWNRWKIVTCPPSFLRWDTRTVCIQNENVRVAVNVHFFLIDCYRRIPDRRNIQCLQRTENTVFIMRNCYSQNFSINKFLSGFVIRNLEVTFTTVEQNYYRLHIEKMPFVRNISLSGIRTEGSFDLTFDFQPVIYSLQIFRYNFTSFTQPPFKNLTNLPILQIVDGNLEDLQENLFQNLNNLKILTLHDNKIKEIPRGFFKDLTLLKHLDLSDNQIENVSEDLFSDLFGLEVLRIKNNKLTVLPQNLLSSLSHLTILQMSDNIGITNLPKGFLKGLTRLEELRASRCSLEHLEESLFSDTRSLKYLILDCNNITRVPEALFNNMENLQLLYMSENKLSTLPPRVFSNLTRLGVLHLAYNKLNHLHKDIFKHLATLIVLRLSDNDLSSLHEDTFLPLLNLREINLSNNNFERLPAKYPFGPSNYLKTVNISNSNLKTFPNIDWSNNNLTEVDLSRNKLREVTLPVFTKKHTKILLDHNNISTVYIDYRRHSNSYPVYNVTGNVIECDCRIRQFLRFLHSDENAVRIFPDSSILRCNGRSERKLTEIWPIYSVCPQKEKCPSLCDCYLTLEDQIAIDCSHRNLSNSPANLPANATFVYLNDNHIANLSEVDGTTWQNVTHLYLTNNSVTSLNDWVVPENLRYLALDGNKLSDLPLSLMKRVEDSSNFSIFLSRNEWKCDCHSVLFKKWFTRNLLKIRDSEDVTCRRVNRVNNSVTHELIQSIPLDVFCLKEPVLPLWQVIVLTVSVVLLVMLAMLIAVSYHYRLAILAFLYSRDVYLPCWNRVLDDEEKKYDAFVCYNSSDSELTMEMVNRLEPTYRLCIHERDWLAGNPISENIVYSVNNSRKTVILLSRQFLDSMWFTVEFRVAYNRMMQDQIHHLVLVLVEELENSKELEEDLRRLLKTKTYLKWGEKWFWEKLKYILRRYLFKQQHILISFQMVQKIFLVHLVFLCTSVEGQIIVSDRFGYVITEMNRMVECGSNVTSYLNYLDRAIYVVCRGNIFDAEQLRVCTNFSYFASVMLRDCVLSFPDVRTSLGDERIEKFSLISEDVPPNSRVTIKNLPNLRDIILYHMENVTYTLEELRNVERIDVLRVMTERFPNGLLNGLPSLRMIYVVLGRIKSFPEDAFRGLIRLKSLHLFDNRLEDLPETLFRGLRSLEELRLHRNLLTFLPPAIFRGLTNLKKLTLNDNRLNTLPPSLFADNFNLIFLNMNNNSFGFLPEMLLQNVSKLQRFGVCNCDISDLSPKIFSSCYDLTEVRICENRIDRLHPDLFLNNVFIQEIYLHKNRLQELPFNVFRRNKWLTKLDLSNNLLTGIPFEVFEDIRNIVALFLAANRITEIEERKFDILKNLKVLNLNNNPIRSISGPRPFGRLPGLTNLGLSNTSFTEFPRIDWTAYNIMLLSLTQNRLSILHTEHLPPDNRSVILLMDNNITTVEGKITKNMNNIILLGNPLRCDCALRNYIEEVQFSRFGRSLLCYSPSDLRNKTFEELVPSYVVCPVVEHCPPKCRCYLYKGFSVMVNCSFSNISHAPAILPENTTIVHLEHNSLSTMKITDNWSGVDELYLDHNRLNPSEHWTFPSSLKVLSLRYNSLQDFPEKFLQYVSESFYIRVDIRNNAFWCNCSFKPFKLWLNRNVRKIMEAEEVMCSRLLSENNTVVVSSVLNFPDDAFCLPPSITTNIPLIVSGSVVSFVVILILLLCFVFLKYRNTILAYVYVHLPSLYCCKISELDKDKAFDAFISYCASDRDMALLLLKNLEGKPPFFKVCIHERDWIPGHCIISQIETSTRNSRKTILLISKEFLNSVWCLAEFQAALVQSLEDKTERIILVLIDNSVRDMIPTDMRELLLTRTYLLWGERWFWEKLRYSLPHYTRNELLRHQVREVNRMVEELNNESAL
ncbi:uncharacterized protein [Centruroides vittatus]|uniref:uncharacterized protein n=1 Tax=Centruroides vittatus TaxID=120091 RepID=UPI00350EAE0D